VTGVDPSLSALVLDYHSTESYAVVLASSPVTRWRVWRSQYRELPELLGAEPKPDANALIKISEAQ
jgi:hypothetical protein